MYGWIRINTYSIYVFNFKSTLMSKIGVINQKKLKASLIGCFFI